MMQNRLQGTSNFGCVTQWHRITVARPCGSGQMIRLQRQVVAPYALILLTAYFRTCSLVRRLVPCSLQMTR